MILDVTTLSLQEIRNLVEKGEISPLTIVTELLKNINSNSDVNAFITITDKLALSQAEGSALRIAKGNPRSLEGIPIAVKDVFCTKSVLTTAASKMLENFIPPYESSVTQKLWNSGAILIGKTNMDEFAMGSSTQTSYFGVCKNPKNPHYVPGGSSGGSAAAVANYSCYAALGSDTGGSVRQPASFCGIVGFKPSYGRCSRFGMIAYSSSLDQAGVFARSVTDACIVMDQIIGKCAQDSTTSSEQWSKLEDIIAKVDGKTIGYIPKQMELVTKDVRQNWELAINILRAGGAKVIEISCNELDSTIGPDQKLTDRWLATYYALTPVEAFSNLSRYDGIRYGTHIAADNLENYYLNTRDQFGKEVKRRILLGGHILLNECHKGHYRKALNYIQNMRYQFNQIFNKVDAILSPTSPHTAFKIGTVLSPEAMYAEDIFTIPANLLMAPAISIPSGVCGDGMPIGIQLMSNRFNESKMIEIAKFLEDQMSMGGK